MKTKGAKALGKRVAEVSAKNGAKLDRANRRALEMSAWSTLAGVAEPGAPPASPPLSGRPSCRARVLLAFSRLVIKPMLPLVVDLIEAQDMMAKIDRWFGGGKDNSARLSVNANGVPAEWIIPEGNSESPRVILYLHGGGFMFNTPRLHARLAARLSQALGAKALLPDYRLAPDHPLPAAHEDCLTAYRWLLDNGHAATDIVIMGDSAGGMLTLATLQRIRDAGLP
ncbi:MAG: alpha/beta hydrolase, partial [Deltaproteobacteria bacterium]